jgi:dienelactone hydrolase
MSAFAPCCLKGFEWDGTPTGRIEQLANNDSYVTGDNHDAAVLIVHDLLGWTYPNVRLLAEHYAKEANVTVYVPDFFGGEVLDFEAVDNEQWHRIDLPGMMQRNSRQVREPEILKCARTLRSKYKTLGAIGFCWGGWAVFRLGAKEHQEPRLVDCISAGHPSSLTKEDIDAIAVPVQMLAPEIDPVYTRELKMHTFETLQKVSVPFEYLHFPGVAHGCLVRGDARKAGERDAMVRGKDAAVAWFRQFLHDA